MDKNNPDSWFVHEFNAQSAVADYANQPPRGMTNPPMNLSLRKTMVKDFLNYGLELEVSEWGGGFGRTASSASAPVSPSNSQPQKLARAASSRVQLIHSYTDKLRSGRVLKAGSIFSRSAPAITGISIDDNDGEVSHPEWHQYHPFQNSLRPIDRTSLLRTPGSKTPKQKRSVRFVDDQKTLEQHMASKISPVHTQFIKTPSHHSAIAMGQRMTLESGKRVSDGTGMAKKGKDSGKDGQKDEDAKKKESQKVDQAELDNRIRALRGNSQLHRAAVADRFRFGAGASAGEPMVLGSSSLAQGNPGNWCSDASSLNKFHNSAIRIVAPSGLEPSKETNSRRKKKKKKDEDLKLSDSGLFVAQYPIDQALVKIRKLRKEKFPQIAKVVIPTREEQMRAVAVAKLKEGFGVGIGGVSAFGLLSRVRESEDDIKEQEAALHASGYDIDYGLF